MRDEGQGTKAEGEKEERLEGKVDGLSLKTPHRLLAPTPWGLVKKQINK